MSDLAIHRRRTEPARVRWALGVTLAVLVADNVLTNRVLGDAWYIPFRLVSTSALLAVAIGLAGCRPSEIGLARSQLGRGLRWGGVVAAATAAVLVAGAILPFTRRFYSDGRVDETGVLDLAYQTLVRIPIGTVAMEELAFRGVVLALLMRLVPALAAVLASSVLFGFWHVLPAMTLADANPAVADIGAGTDDVRLTTVVLAVVSTTIAGIWLCWLRLRARHIVTPIAVHIASNSVAYTLAWIVLRSGW